MLCLILGILVAYLQTNLENGDLEAVIPISVVALLMLVTLVAMYAQPTSNMNLSFKVSLQINLVNYPKIIYTSNKSFI